MAASYIFFVDLSRHHPLPSTHTFIRGKCVMLDVDLQSKLQDVMHPQKDKKILTGFGRKALFYIILFGMVLSVGVAASELRYGGASVSEEHMAKLVVLVADKTNQLPVDVWAMAETKVGKKMSQLDAEEQLQVINILMDHMQENSVRKDAALW